MIDEGYGYGVAHTRLGLTGTVDKLALVEGMALKYAHNRDIQELVLRVVKDAGNSALDQAKVWVTFCENLPYRREPAEILRNPVVTGVQAHGGDCDDLTVLALAGLLCLSLPCKAEIVANGQSDGYHIRCLVGFPPTSPKVWYIADPTWRSEKEWAMMNQSAFDKGSWKSRMVTPKKGDKKACCLPCAERKPCKSNQNPWRWATLGLSVLLLLSLSRNRTT